MNDFKRPQTMKKYLVLLILLCAPLLTAYADSNWTLLQNNALGFSIKYPANIKPTKKFTKDYLMQDSWSVESESPFTKGQVPIVQFIVADKKVKTKYLGTQRVMVFLRAVMSTRKQDLQSCYQLKYAKTLPDKIFNHRSYKQFSFSDAAMKKQLDARIFRYKTDNACYSIEVISAFADANSQKINNILKAGHKLALQMLQILRI